MILAWFDPISLTEVKVPFAITQLQMGESEHPVYLHVAAGPPTGARLSELVIGDCGATQSAAPDCGLHQFPRQIAQLALHLLLLSNKNWAVWNCLSPNNPGGMIAGWCRAGVTCRSFAECGGAAGSSRSQLSGTVPGPPPTRAAMAFIRRLLAWRSAPVGQIMLPPLTEPGQAALGFARQPKRLGGHWWPVG